MTLQDVLTFLNKQNDKTLRDTGCNAVYRMTLFADGSGNVADRAGLRVASWNSLSQAEISMSGRSDHSELIANLRKIADQLESEGS